MQLVQNMTLTDLRRWGGPTFLLGQKSSWPYMIALIARTPPPFNFGKFFKRGVAGEKTEKGGGG
jgi:hypothetical protein